MKKETLNKRLLKLENVSKGSKAYQVIKELTGMYTIKNNWNQVLPLSSGIVRGDVIRPCYTQGSGRHTSVADHAMPICMLLDKLKIKYITGNDAPRGGQCGKYIKILTKLD